MGRAYSTRTTGSIGVAEAVIVAYGCVPVALNVARTPCPELRTSHSSPHKYAALEQLIWSRRRLAAVRVPSRAPAKLTGVTRSETVPVWWSYTGGEIWEGEMTRGCRHVAPLTLKTRTSAERAARSPMARLSGGWRSHAFDVSPPSCESTHERGSECQRGRGCERGEGYEL
jgi:hypothetical protein